MADSVLKEKQGHVLVLTLDRIHKKNALTLDMYEALRGALEEASSDNTRAVVIAGKDGCFTAGNDIQDFLENPPTGEDSPVSRFLSVLSAFEKPLVAAVPGLAIGIGTTMLLHCDFVIAAESATFRLPFVDLALVPEAGSSFLLPRFVGHQKAAEFLLEGRTFTAEEVALLGLVNKVVPDKDVMDQALALASNIATKPPEAVRLTKSLMKKKWDSVEEAMKEEGALFAKRLQSPEAREAFLAFMEGRKPDFSKFD